MNADQKVARTHVQLLEGYRFAASFPDTPAAPALTLDEPAPIGGGEGPNPAAVLAAAVGGCLASSLTLCLSKAHLEPDAVNANVTANIARNEAGRFRISGIDVDLSLCIPSTDQARLERCKTLFQDFCMVTESVRHGIPVNVHLSACGEALKRSA